MAEKKGFFPLFLDIRGKKVLFIGGGRIASRRVGVMSGFDCEISVVSPSVTQEIQALADSGCITWISSKFEDEMINDAHIVLACTNDPELNHRIVALCSEKNILVNNCADHSECDFYFPGIVTHNEMTVAVNAGGKAHAKAAALRRKIAELMEKETYNE